MSKRRLCLSSLCVLFAVVLMAAFLPFSNSSTVKAQESVVYDRSVKVDFNAAGTSINDVCYASDNVALVSDVDLGNGKFTALSTASGSSKGYVIFYFKAPEGKAFASLDLEFLGRLFDYNNFRTFECVNFYVGSDIEVLDECEVVYKSLISTNASGQTVNLDLDSFVAGKPEFFVKLEIGNSSANKDWCAVKEVSFNVSYLNTKVIYNLIDDFGGSKQVEVFAEAGSPVGIDTALYFANFERTDAKVYKDFECTEAVADGELIEADAEYYVKGIWDKHTITYVLNGGINHKDNPTEYVASVGAELKAAGRKGYKFVGWYLDSELTQPIYTLTATSGNVTVYAKWVEDIPLDKEVSVKDNTEGEGCSSSVSTGTMLTSIAAMAAAGLFLSFRLIKRKSK